MLNEQPQEPRVDPGVVKIDYINTFKTIQGEGPFVGFSSVFVRLAGCNLQCPWCDTQYTEGRKEVTPYQLETEILNKVAGVGSKMLVVITGGEPLRQALQLDPLIIALIGAGCLVQIETNGVFGLTDTMRYYIANDDLIVVCSPKTPKVHSTMQYAHAFKYVIEAGEVSVEDGLPIKALGNSIGKADNVARPPEGFKGLVYVNPMDAKNIAENKRNMDACKSSALQFNHVLGIQLHKEYGLE